MTESVLIVDGMALLFRGYFASAYGGYIRRTSAGVPTNAVYGFTRYLLDAIRKFKPGYVVCCWDTPVKPFRTELYPAYKGNRPEAPDDLLPQFGLVRHVTDGLGIPNVELRGYEADDCIGTLAKRFADDREVYIVSGDHDLLQLVGPRTRVVLLKKGFGQYAVYDPETLLEEKQLRPEQIVDLKGLTGDASDNYPGVKGIGEKTAVKLLLEHDSIDGIIGNLDSLSGSVRKKIEADLDMLHLCRDLATIRCDVPLDCELDGCRWEPDEAVLRSKFLELEFESLMKEASGLLARIG
ncbi:5'-3' exonuclease [Gordoniibacillus kamchatkensis]|uniref:5'-3' exonuclease n=1 Tax=Gordoniibacillus kamchatkensis TaxID=1590651 RepID=A0ABR5ANG9_9BACL|nr:5'-3' exonuclease H3TH domain-containing protein [Paenibacillus sp. VKM B-2647]KIL41907.1 5'-3' exonuclease [Paenibacillus sp. VKM B-2647]